MSLNLELEIPDEFLREHEIVAKTHEERGCL